MKTSGGVKRMTKHSGGVREVREYGGGLGMFERQSKCATLWIGKTKKRIIVRNAYKTAVGTSKRGPKLLDSRRQKKKKTDSNGGGKRAEYDRGRPYKTNRK